MDATYWHDLLRPVVTRTRWIVVGGPLAGLVRDTGELRGLGSAPVLCLGSSRGTGSIPAEEDATCVTVDEDAPARDIVHGFHRYEGRLRDLPADARVAVEAFDPEGVARVIGRILLSPLDEVAGRARWPREDPTWRRLEDKCVLPEFLDAHGLPGVPCEIVPCEADALAAAAARLDRGMGTVWVPDARDGLHGGATYVRWVRNEDDAREARETFAPRCDRVRVSSFLEGVPCSIHVLVSADEAVAFRPFEMLTLRRPGESRLVYSGVADWWDPAPEDREAMRAVGRRCGEALRDTLGFRGTFTVDGVMAADGFAITELNMRVGGALGVLEDASKAPIGLLALALASGDLEGDPRLGALEELVVEKADAHRVGRAMTLPKEAGDGVERGLVKRDGEWRLALPGETPWDAVVVWGPGPNGGFLRVMATSGGMLEPGPPFAPEAIELLRWAEREMGVDPGPLEAPVAVR